MYNNNTLTYDISHTNIKDPNPITVISHSGYNLFAQMNNLRNNKKACFLKKLIRRIITCININ